MPTSENRIMRMCADPYNAIPKIGFSAITDIGQS